MRQNPVSSHNQHGSTPWADAFTAQILPFEKVRSIGAGNMSGKSITGQGEIPIWNYKGKCYLKKTTKGSRG